MSYIGVPPVTGDFVILDTISTSATASYTLQRNSSNFSPESANHMLVSLNGSIQKPNSSFTVSGSTITFSSALTSSDVIDFILVLGNVNAVGVATTVSDNAITDAKTNFVSTSSAAGLQIKGDGTTDGTLQLNCSQNSHGVKLKSPAHSAGQSYTLTLPTTSPSANKFLQTDGSGNLSFADAGGNTPAFFVIKTGNQSISAYSSTKVTYNSEKLDSDSKFDTSTSRFTPTVAGQYFLIAQIHIQAMHNQATTELDIKKNGSYVASRFKHIAANSSDDKEPSLFTSCIVESDTDDYFEVIMHTDMGGGTTITGDAAGFTFFGGYLLGGT
jgi:hypothetical protein